MLCLLELFSDKKIRVESHWDTEVPKRVGRFVSALPRDGRTFERRMPTHASLSFLLGSFLDTKSRLSVVPIQDGHSGSERWCVNTTTSRTYPDPQIHESTIAQGVDLAVAISFTHDIARDVTEYLQRQSVPVGRLIEFRLGGQPHNVSVVDGTHAVCLASRIVEHLRTISTPAERAAPYHIFLAAPNGVTFQLGQVARVLGRYQLYEHDFGGDEPRAYMPSVTLPTGP